MFEVFLRVGTSIPGTPRLSAAVEDIVSDVSRAHLPMAIYYSKGILTNF